MDNIKNMVSLMNETIDTVTSLEQTLDDYDRGYLDAMTLIRDAAVELINTTEA